MEEKAHTLAVNDLNLKGSYSVGRTFIPSLFLDAVSPKSYSLKVMLKN